MKHSILKRAIQIKDLVSKSDGVYITISLLSYRNEIFSDTIFIAVEDSINMNEQQLLNTAVIKFKEDQRYISYIAQLNAVKISEDLDGVEINKLTLEYNKINDVSNLRYLENSYPKPSIEDFDKKVTKRYFAKFLNQNNVFLELNFDDYNSLVTQNPSIHYEAYDYFSMDWVINGTRDEILEKNSIEIDKQNRLFPGFKSFHNTGEYKAGVYYITVYDEIRNLYTPGRELVYADTIENFAGYYHLGYFDGNLSTLISGKNIGTGDDRILLEVETFEETPTVIETQNIINEITKDVNSIISSMDLFLSSLSAELTKIELQSTKEIQNMVSTVDKLVESTVKGTDVEEVFTKSRNDFKVIAKSVASDTSTSSREQSQNKIAESYSDKSQSVSKQIPPGDRVSVAKKLKNSRTPKVKIPSSTKKHGIGTGHSYPLGF